MRSSRYISFFTILLCAVSICYGQKNESLKEESLDDIEALSSKDFPYIEKFHEAVREKLSGNFDEAKTLFEDCLKQKTDDDAVHFGLAEIAKEQSQPKIAQAHFEKAYGLDEENIVYIQELAYLAYEQGQFENAAIYYNKLVDRQPRNVDWIYGYSQVLIYNKRYEDAVNMLEKLQDQVGIVPEIMMMKADLYQEIDQLDKTEKTLLELCNEYPENKEALQTLILFYEKNDMPDKAKNVILELASTNPENMLFQMKLASIYAESGDQVKFLQTLKPIIGSDEVNASDKIFQIEQLLTFFKVEKLQLLELTSMLIDVNGEDPSAALLHAEVLTQNNQSKEALSFYRKALDKSGDQFEVWATVLAFESAYNDYHALYEDGQKALTYFPNMPFVYYAAAEGAIYTDKPEEALDILSAGELYLLDDQKQKARFSMRRGEAYFALKEYKKGIQEFEKALSIYPEQMIRVNYALSLSRAEIALSVAKEQLAKVSEEQRSSKFYLAKAQLSIAKKDYSEAEETLKLAVEKNAYNAELYDKLGDVFLLKENPEKALEYWTKALEKGSRNSVIAQKIKEQKLYAPKYY
jgi:tetratricopeptide (TPR) repeat protein